MTQYTRRSFIKRAGSASLGTALGLGLIPSVTSKLKAADTSTLATGVVMQLNGTTTRATNSSTSYGGHNIEVGVEILSYPTPGTCLRSIAVRWRRWYQVTLVGSTTPTLSQQIWTVTWTCVNGVLSSSTQYDTSAMTLNDLPYPAVAPNPPGSVTVNHDDTQVSEGSNALSVVVFDGFEENFSTPVTTPALSHSVVCCPLAA